MDKDGTLRQDKMAPGQRMKAVTSGARPDRIPLVLQAQGFFAKTVGYPISSIYNEPEKSFWAQLRTLEMYGCDGVPTTNLAPSYAFGADIRFPNSEWQQSPVATRYPVESEEDVWNLQLPDLRTAPMIQLAMEFHRICERNHMPVTPLVGSPLTCAAVVCSVETICRWMMKKPEVVHRLLRVVTDNCLQTAEYWIETFGTNRITTPYSATPVESNQVISPRYFQEFALPYLKELHEKLLDMGIRRFLCHICGEQNLNLPYYKEVPMGKGGILSFGHEVDLTTAMEYFGDTYIIAGNIEPQVIQNGTPEQVYELTRQCIEKAKYAPRGFILMPGCELPPNSPPYNVYTIKKAINDFGWYD